MFWITFTSAVPHLLDSTASFFFCFGGCNPKVVELGILLGDDGGDDSDPTFVSNESWITVVLHRPSKLGHLQDSSGTSFPFLPFPSRVHDFYVFFNSNA